MTLIFMEGGETGDLLQRYDEVVGIDYVAGRNGNGIRVINGGSNRLRKTLEAAAEHATWIIGRAFKSTTTNPADNSSWIGGGATFGNLFSFCSDNGATIHISVQLGNGNQVVVTRGGMNGTILGSYVVANASYLDWYYFEAKCVLHDTTGSVEVKMNGQTIILLTNIDTKNGGTKTVFDSFGVGPPQTLNGIHSIIDDLYICNGAGSVNNTFLGDVAVETLYPSGDGSSSQFLGSDGNSVSNYLLVDEAGAPILTDYVEDGVSGHRDLYAIGNLVRAAGPILGVQVSDHLLNTDAGAVSAKVAVKSGATVAYGTALPLTTSWQQSRKLFELNPDGSVAWDIAAVNAIEAGVEVV